MLFKVLRITPFFAAAISCALVGCSGTSVISKAPIPNAQGLSSTLQRGDLSYPTGVKVEVAPAPPYDDAFTAGVHSSKAKLLRDSTPQLNLDPKKGPGRMLNLRGAAAKRSIESYIYGNGGQATLSPPNGLGKIGIYTNHTAYLPTSVTLRAPINNNSFDLLYAPTTKPPDGGCLETGTDYWVYRDGSGNVYPPASTLRIYSFCGASANSFVVAKNIDSTFFSNYVRYFSNSESKTAMYTMEVKILSDGLWHALIYNYSLGVWEDLYQVGGRNTYYGGIGWSLFETHYDGGNDLCSKMPTISSDGLRLQSADHTWALNTTANGGSNGYYGNCINTGVSPYTSVIFDNAYYYSAVGL